MAVRTLLTMSPSQSAFSILQVLKVEEKTKTEVMRRVLRPSGSAGMHYFFIYTTKFIWLHQSCIYRSSSFLYTICNRKQHPQQNLVLEDKRHTLVEYYQHGAISWRFRDSEIHRVSCFVTSVLMEELPIKLFCV